MPDGDEYSLDEIKTALRRKLNLMGPDERETALRELERNPNLSDVVNEYRYPTPGAWTEEAFKPAAPVKVGGYVTRAGVTRPTGVEYGPTPELPRKRVTWAPPSTPPVGTIPGVYWPGGMPTPPVGTEPYWRVPTAEETIKAGGRAGIEAAKTVGRTFQGKKPFGLFEIGKPEETPPPEGLPGVVGRMVPSFLGFGEPLTLEELRQQPPWMQAAMATGMGAPLESLALAAQQAPAALRTATTGLKQRGRAVLATGERGAVGPFGKGEVPFKNGDRVLITPQGETKPIPATVDQAYFSPFFNKMGYEVTLDDGRKLSSGYTIQRIPEGKPVGKVIPTPSIKPPSEKLLNLGTGSPESDVLLARYRELKASGRPMTANEEKGLAIYEAQAKADPLKWEVGDGVGWKVAHQTNRGFRIIGIDPESKMAKIRSVADTGLTITGGAEDKIPDRWVHVADLIRDNKYNAPIRLSVTPAAGGLSKEEISTKVRQFQEDYWRKNPPPSTDITNAKMKGKSRQELWSERFRKATKEYEDSLEAVTPAVAKELKVGDLVRSKRGVEVGRIVEDGMYGKSPAWRVAMEGTRGTRWFLKSQVEKFERLPMLASVKEPWQMTMAEYWDSLSLSEKQRRLREAKQPFDLGTDALQRPWESLPSGEQLPLKTILARNLKAEEWFHAQPLPQGIPSSASNLKIFQLREAFSEGRFVPPEVLVDFPSEAAKVKPLALTPPLLAKEGWTIKIDDTELRRRGIVDAQATFLGTKEIIFSDEYAVMTSFDHEMAHVKVAMMPPDQRVKMLNEFADEVLHVSEFQKVSAPGGIREGFANSYRRFIQYEKGRPLLGEPEISEAEKAFFKKYPPLDVEQPVISTVAAKVKPPVGAEVFEAALEAKYPGKAVQFYGEEGNWIRGEALDEVTGKTITVRATTKAEAQSLLDAELAKVEPPVTEIPKAEAVSPKVRVEVPPTEPPVKLPTEGPPPPPVVSKVKPPPGEVPPAPVVTPEGKLWLPEPPRTGAYMESARKEVAGSFRKKIGVFDIVEQAHQQVLKARDLGENAINYVGSYLRQAGNMTKEFGLDAQGIATKVGNPEGRSLAINDILSNYTHYTLTPAQTEIAKRHGFVYKEALKLAKSYGVDISELGGPDEYWQYIARRVKGKLNPATGQFEMPPPVTGGFRMGAKISAQKERVFEEMAQGVDLGLLYEHPDQVMVQHLKGIYRLIGNKQAQNTVKGLTRAITEEAPVVFGERALAQPALRGRAAAVELANAIDKIFTPEQEIKALRVLADISSALVGQTAALDVSAPFIQGLTVLGHDLKMALKGKPTAIWAKAYARMWRAVWNPKTIDTFRAANHDLYKRAQEAGVITGQSEFVSGVPVTGRMLGKVPGVGKTLKEAYRQTWGRAGQAYSDFLEVSRIKMFEQMEGAWERSGGNVYDLGAVVNRMSGATSAAARGVGTTRRLVERIAAFAPNYIRASLLLIKDMAGRRATAKEVQSTLATLLGVGFAVYYAEEKVRGREPKIKPWPKRFGGDGAEAFTTEIGGHRVGLGSWMYGMIKTLAEIGAIAVDDPSALVVFDEQHPLMRFAKSKQGPALSLTRELATGKNFWGEDFETPQDYLLRVAEAITPISGQSLVQKGTGLPKTTVERATPLLLDPLGLRVFPSNISKFTELAEKQGIARGREWPELEPWEKAKISMSPEGRVLIKALYQKETVKRWQIRWNAYDMQLKRDVELKAGKIKGSDWKDAYYQAQSVLAAQLDQFDEDFKRMRYSPETPEDKALSGYYDTMDKAKSETGIFDGDKWEELRRDYMKALSLELQKYIEDNIGIYDTPQAQNFRRVREILEPYWNLEAQVWSQYGAQAETLKDLATRLDVMATTDERKAKQFMLENPQLVSRIFTAQKQIANLKLAWKVKHLDEAALLKKFYTY